MVKVNTKDNNKIITWGGYLTNPAIFKENNKYGDKLEIHHSGLFSYFFVPCKY